jgi:hypothetical protein
LITDQQKEKELALYNQGYEKGVKDTAVSCAYILLIGFMVLAFL